jgi:Ca2+-binding RTX toxin-like protein
VTVSGAQRGDRFGVAVLGSGLGDVLTAVSGDARAHYFNAGLGDDTVTGGVADDVLVGGAGADSFIGGAGADRINGGAGDDLVADFNLATSGADATDLGEGSDRVLFAGAAGQIRLTFTSAQVGDGDPLDPTGVAGLNVRAQAEGSTDNPTGTVARFDDEGITFVAGSGQTFDVRDTGGAARGDQFGVVVLGTSAADTLTVGPDARAYYFNAGAGNDTVTGAAANDFLVGGAGDDSLSGLAGDDRFLGGAGNDLLAGGAGADTLDGGAGSDTASYAASAAAVAIVLGGAASGGDATGDTLIGIENLLGSAFSDSLTGDAAANQLDGAAGDDLLEGGRGVDHLLGGAAPTPSASGAPLKA